MASSSSTSASFTFPNVAHLVTTKLDHLTYLQWNTQVVPILIANDLLGIVEGTEPCPPKHLPASSEQAVPSLNPAYSLWVKKDQFILSWLNSTLADSVLTAVYGLRTSRQVWQFLSTKFASQSRTRINQLMRQLQTLHQGNKSCTEFINAAKHLSHQLAAAGRAISDEDLITYVLGGLHPSFNPFVPSFFCLHEIDLCHLKTFMLN